MTQHIAERTYQIPNISYTDQYHIFIIVARNSKVLGKTLIIIIFFNLVGYSSMNPGIFTFPLFFSDHDLRMVPYKFRWKLVFEKRPNKDV